MNDITNLQNNEIRHLKALYQYMGTRKFLWKFPSFLSIWLQMAHVPLLKAL